MNLEKIIRNTILICALVVLTLNVIYAIVYGDSFFNNSTYGGIGCLLLYFGLKRKK